MLERRESGPREQRQRASLQRALSHLRFEVRTGDAKGQTRSVRKDKGSRCCTDVCLSARPGCTRDGAAMAVQPPRAWSGCRSIKNPGSATTPGTGGGSCSLVARSSCVCSLLSALLLVVLSVYRRPHNAVVVDSRGRGVAKSAMTDERQDCDSLIGRSKIRGVSSFNRAFFRGGVVRIPVRVCMSGDSTRITAVYERRTTRTRYGYPGTDNSRLATVCCTSTGTAAPVPAPTKLGYLGNKKETCRSPWASCPVVPCREVTPGGSFP